MSTHDVGYHATPLDPLGSARDRVLEAVGHWAKDRHSVLRQLALASRYAEYAIARHARSVTQQRAVEAAQRNAAAQQERRLPDGGDLLRVAEGRRDGPLPERRGRR